MHCCFVVISDWFFWRLGKRVVGKEATKVALLFYLSNRVQNAYIVRCFTNAIEEILNIIAFYVYLKLDKNLTKWTVIFTLLVSFEFTIRNTAPVGWVPLLFLKSFRDGAFCSFVITGLFVAVPFLVATTYIDSIFYSYETGKFEWTVTGYNFLHANLVEGGSLYFGVDPWWAYIGKYFWAQFNAMYPLIAYSVYFYWNETRSKG